MTPPRSALAPVLAAPIWAALALSLPAQAQPPAQTSGDILPESPGKALVVSACTTCHQAEVVVAKRRTAAEWDEVIGKMVDRGATLSDAEQDQIYDYLVKNFGAEGAVAPTHAPAGSPSPKN
jgi:cytochrome c5